MTNATQTLAEIIVAAGRYRSDAELGRSVRTLLERNDMIAKKAQQQAPTNVFLAFEEEFGRPLSPMECGMMNDWIDQDGIAEEVILVALREAVLSKKLNVRYIDRILLNWKQSGVRTAQDATEQARKFRQKYAPTEKVVSPPTSQEQTPQPFPFYNWLEE